jgi:hypothetical protein
MNIDKTMPTFEMMKSGGGLTARNEGIAYYIAVINKKSELKEWFQLARDFELSGERSLVTTADLQKRYDNINASGTPYHASSFTRAMKTGSNSAEIPIPKIMQHKPQEIGNKK